MNPRFLITCLAAALLTSGCAKGFSSGPVADRHGQMDFHARDMIVPDFHAGPASAQAPVKCRQASTLQYFDVTDPRDRDVKHTVTL